MLVTSALTEGGCNAQSTGRPFPCLGFRPLACRDRTIQSGSPSPGPAGARRRRVPDDACRHRTARRAVRQQPVSDRDGATEPEFHGRSVARAVPMPRSRSSISDLDDRARRRARGRGARRGRGAPAPAEAQRGPHRRRRRHRRRLAARAHHRHAEPLRRRPASTRSSTRSCCSSNATDSWRSAAIPRRPPSPCSAWASSAPASSTTRATST